MVLLIVFASGASQGFQSDEFGVGLEYRFPGKGSGLDVYTYGATQNGSRDITRKLSLAKPLSRAPQRMQCGGEPGSEEYDKCAKQINGILLLAIPLSLWIAHEMYQSVE